MEGVDGECGQVAKDIVATHLKVPKKKYIHSTNNSQKCDSKFLTGRIVSKPMRNTRSTLSTIPLDATYPKLNENSPLTRHLSIFSTHMLRTRHHIRFLNRKNHWLSQSNNYLVILCRSNMSQRCSFASPYDIERYISNKMMTSAKNDSPPRKIPVLNEQWISVRIPRRRKKQHLSHRTGVSGG